MGCFRGNRHKPRIFCLARVPNKQNKPHLYVIAMLWNIGSRVVCTCIQAVLTTSVKILPYRPPAQLIRANYCPCTPLSSIFTIYTDLFVKGICI